jgi:hypothetical protein
MKRRARTVAATFAPVRRLVMLLVLVAFAFQAYVVQTHIHGASARLVQVSQAHSPAKPLPNDPLDPATCKLCQELVHAGAAITPMGAELTLVTGWAVSRLVPARSVPLVQAPRTGWQSRAPPKA